MHTVSQIDPDLYTTALRKQAELWDRIIAVLSGEWERGFSRSWTVRPRVTLEEVMEDLEYGRE
ncbi:MAG: hypothetical protein JSV06_12985 [Myxococcales bacterium]|nr:MAG: hypothetical protein JSV06_12985 [Myxococcales bacterium]